MERLGAGIIPLFLILLVFSFFWLPFANAHEGKDLYERKPVCLKEYPTDPGLFNENVRPYVSKIIERHGLEEWKAVLLTNELHRHLDP